jgi:uncharacterized membrane protein
MNFEPIASAPLAIKIHLATVLPAFLIGGWLIILSAKGSKPHRAFGVIYMVLMVVTAFTTFFIRALDPPHLSWIHLFIPITLVGVTMSILSLRRGDIRGHRRAMILLYVGALVIAGGFTFVPGRIMHAVFFS